MLPDEELHTWQLSLDVAEDDLDDLVNFLSDGERGRAAEFRFERDRRRYAAGRGFLRCILASYLSCSPSEISFVYGPHGKPAVADSALQFNVAHCDSLAVIGVARSCPVGIDVERLRPIADVMDIASRFFSPAERAALAALRPEDQLSGFFTCWTRKEAYLKAMGEGMASPLFDKFKVPLTPKSPPQVMLCGTMVDDLAGCSFWDLPFGANYAGVAAVLGEIRTLQHRIWHGPYREGRRPTADDA